MKRSAVSGFDVVWAGGEARASGATGDDGGDGGGAGPLVIMLHGFGAPGDDLVPFCRILDVPKTVRFAFPAAPLDLGELAPGARAWWWIDMEERMRRMARGEARDENEIPEGFEAVAERVALLVDALRGESACVLAGFSQGAMLSLEVALRTAAPPTALALLSSTILAKASQAPRLSRLAGTPILQSHGQNDPVLPFASAEKLRDFLKGEALDVTWVPFRGGHEIPDAATGALSKLIAATLRATT